MVGHIDKEDETTQFAKLTRRELVILKCLARGLSDHEIATRLVLSLNTVKWYNRKIFEKLGVCSRTQAIARGHDMRIFDNELPGEDLPG